MSGERGRSTPRGGTRLSIAGSLMAILILPACFEDPEAASPVCSFENCAVVGDFIGIDGLAPSPAMPLAGEPFAIEWTRWALNSGTEGCLGMFIEQGNATVRVTLDSESATPLAVHEEPFDYTFDADPPFPGDGEDYSAEESVGIEEILPTWVDDLGPGSYSVTVELLGTNICGANLGQDPSQTIEFEIFDASGCPAEGVDRLDLEVEGLAFQPGEGGGVVWTVNYLVETSGGPISPGGEVTLIERLTVIHGSNGAELFSGERTGVQGELLPGESVDHLWPIASIELVPPPGGDDVVIRIEVEAVEVGSECGTADLAANNSAEVITPTQ